MNKDDIGDWLIRALVLFCVLGMILALAKTFGR